MRSRPITSIPSLIARLEAAVAVLETAAAARAAERQALAQRVATLEAAATATMADLDALIDAAEDADG